MKNIAKSAENRADSAQINTTCELYHATDPLDLRSSVQSALYYYLHCIRNGVDEFVSKEDAQYSNSSSLEKIKKSARDLSRRLEYQYQLANPSRCDVLFNFFIFGSHSFGIQKKLAEKCQSIGLRTGIVGESNRVNSSDSRINSPAFDSVLPLRKFSQISTRNGIPSRIHKEIVEQCEGIYQCLKVFDLFRLDPKEYLLLAHFATQIEKQAHLLQRLLATKKPKLVVLTHGKTLGDVAMQLACQNLGIPSMLILHGFPQRSLSRISASHVVSYCPHHNNYLKAISSPSSQIKEFGWMEPSVQLSDSVHNVSNTSSNGNYNVLFLSSMSGWDLHRCPSLVERMPDILKALSATPSIRTITVRLRRKEANDLVLKTLLLACAGSKLKISVDRTIEKDLRECDVVMSFNSTGLLYGPYLNKKAIEIRDRSINSIWGNTVLPAQQVYEISEVFNPGEFGEFVLDAPILRGENVFHNWRCELEAFSQFLSELN